MSDQLDIVVTSMDVGASEAAQRLAQAFDLSVVEAEQFVRELPRVAKRNASREEAARYVEALKAIGARVETLASEAARPTLRARIAAGASDQLLIDPQPQAEPAMRFRASGSLGMISMPPEEVHIPKAPLIPHDLSRMPNGAELPMPSIRPPAFDEGDEGEPRRHTDAQMPPPLVAAARQMAQSPIHSPMMVARSVHPGFGDESDGPTPRERPQPPRNEPTVAGSASRGNGKAVAVALLLCAVAFAVVRFFG